MNSKRKCCDVTSMCGLNLWQGVIFVGTSTIVICSLIFIISAVTLGHMVSETENQYNKNPVLAINILFVLYSSCISSYQIVISALLVWHALKHIKDGVFFCTLWYVSHLSILSLYCFLFSARTIITFNAKQYFSAIVTVVCAAVYKALFIYFSVVVNSYLHSLEAERYV
ncbi:uncharacterized protein LOC115452883 [Manduca sexta]|uniref:uncharacterized protein LOC115452883 n=1 Tax=Manduca sexta TaxID=7130 RepID=UPI00189046A6|nr:uncharacterized protein LOC115452883 [Manduca sexta]